MDFGFTSKIGESSRKRLVIVTCVIDYKYLK